MKLFNFIDTNIPIFSKIAKSEKSTKFTIRIFLILLVSILHPKEWNYISFIFYLIEWQKEWRCFFWILMEDINNQFKEIYFNSRCFWVFGCKIPVKNTRIAKGILILFLMRYFWSNIPWRGGRCMNTTKLLSRLNIWKCWS